MVFVSDSLRLVSTSVAVLSE